MASKQLGRFFGPSAREASCVQADVFLETVDCLFGDVQSTRQAEASDLGVLTRSTDGSRRICGTSSTEEFSLPESLGFKLFGVGPF